MSEPTDKEREEARAGFKKAAEKAAFQVGLGHTMVAVDTLLVLARQAAPSSPLLVGADEAQKALRVLALDFLGNAGLPASDADKIKKVWGME